jgi:hypothetical protein
MHVSVLSAALAINLLVCSTQNQTYHDMLIMQRVDNVVCNLPGQTSLYQTNTATISSLLAFPPPRRQHNRHFTTNGHASERLTLDR